MLRNSLKTFSSNFCLLQTSKFCWLMKSFSSWPHEFLDSSPYSSECFTLPDFPQGQMTGMFNLLNTFTTNTANMTKPPSQQHALFVNTRKESSPSQAQDLAKEFSSAQNHSPSLGFISATSSKCSTESDEIFLQTQDSMFLKILIELALSSFKYDPFYFLIESFSIPAIICKWRIHLQQHHSPPLFWVQCMQLFNLSVVSIQTWHQHTALLRQKWGWFNLHLFFYCFSSSNMKKMENTLTLYLWYANTLWYPCRQVLNGSLVWTSLPKMSKMCKYHPFYWLLQKSCLLEVSYFVITLKRLT